MINPINQHLCMEPPQLTLANFATANKICQNSEGDKNKGCRLND